jgi:hypothetical protein
VSIASIFAFHHQYNNLGHLSFSMFMFELISVHINGHRHACECLVYRYMKADIVWAIPMCSPVPDQISGSRSSPPTHLSCCWPGCLIEAQTLRSRVIWWTRTLGTLISIFETVLTAMGGQRKRSERTTAFVAPPSSLLKNRYGDQV